MENEIFDVKNVVLWLSIILSITKIYSQSAPPIGSIPSPTAGNLGVYGAYPVSHFTGVPDISIPIYEFQEHDISIPIGLRYNVAGVKPDSHPGWVGLGWSLQAGGVITRAANKTADEQWHREQGGLGYLWNTNLLSPNDWHSDDFLRAYAQLINDTEPDEFNFNFLGYSGTFYRTHDDKWAVIADQDIKIDHSWTTLSGVRDEIADIVPHNVQGLDGIPFDQDQSFHRYLDKFTLTTPDGYKYVFGGKYATEYNVVYRKQDTSPLFPVSWYLSKITSPTGHDVFLNYTTGEPVASLYSNYSYYKIEDQSSSGWLDTPCDPFEDDSGLGNWPAEGWLSLPVYLSSISGNNVEIEFENSQTNELRYDDFDFDCYSNLSRGYTCTRREIWFQRYARYFDYNKYSWMHDSNGLQWRQLDNITIKYQDEYRKRFKLTYTDSPTERLKLLSLQEVGLKKDGIIKDVLVDHGLISLYENKEVAIETISKPPYLFNYNSTNLPEYLSDKIDHWGYYNGNNSYLGNNISSYISDYYNARNPDATGVFQKAEVLEKITYPTGGYSTFDYEPHTYSQVVSVERTSLEPVSNTVAGGLRIKDVKSYNGDNSLQTHESYYYVKGYTSGSDPSTLPSSGILGGKVKYWWPDYRGKDENGDWFEYDLFSSGSLYPYGLNSQGSHVGYSEVIKEVKSGSSSINGYSKFLYSNFDQDIWQESHKDDLAINWIDFDRSEYSPFTSNANERGKLLSEQYFNISDELVKERKLRYEKSTADFVRTVSTGILDVCGNNVNDFMVFGTAYKINVFNYRLIYDEMTDVNSGSFTTTNTYGYNNNNLIESIETEYPDGALYETNIRYNTEFQDNLTFKSMLKRNIVDKPVETIIMKEGKVISGKINKYQCVGCTKIFFTDYYIGGFFAPSEVLSLDISLPITDYEDATSSTLDDRYSLSFDYTGYDSDGNITQFVGEDGVETSLIWGYDDQYVIARADNASPDEIVYSSFENGFGGWTIGYGQMHDDGATGKKSVEPLGSTVSTIDKLPAGSYLVSMYLKNYKGTGGAVTVEGHSIEPFWAGNKKWSYGERIVNLSTDSRIALVNTLGQDIQFDEVRVYPLDATMQTYSHEPLIGIKEIVDTNGEIIRYEYDELARLHAKKDLDGNYLERYRYNYQNADNPTCEIIVSGSFHDGTVYTGENFQIDAICNYYGLDLSEYHWNINGEIVNTNSEKFDHVFNTGGSKDISLSVVNVESCEVISISKNVNVKFFDLDLESFSFSPNGGKKTIFFNTTESISVGAFDSSMIEIVSIQSDRLVYKCLPASSTSGRSSSIVLRTNDGYSKTHLVNQSGTDSCPGTCTWDETSKRCENFFGEPYCDS